MTNARLMAVVMISLLVCGLATAGVIWGVRQGGTGTAGPFTVGSVVFAGGGGIYAQDNTHFKYTDATDTLFATNATGNTVASTGANGQAATIRQLTELTTIAAAATTTTTIQIPANAIVLAVSVRVTVLIPTAATFTVIGNTSTTAFQTGTNVAVAAGTTDAGTKSCPYLNTAAQTIRITPNATPADNTGRVRVTITYIEITPPTS